MKLLRNVFPVTIRLMGDHVYFVQEVLRNLQCLPMIWAIYVVKDVSIRLNILTLEASVILECLCTGCAHWARILRRPPTASPVILGTGVLWVSTGTHPCGSPSRQDDGETRAPALHTLDDVLRFRGDEEYRAVLLHPSSTCSCLRSGRS